MTQEITIEDGNRILVDSEDAHRFESEWYLGRNYVFHYLDGGRRLPAYILVAERVFGKLTKHQRVVLKDGDPCNLTSSNIEIIERDKI